MHIGINQRNCNWHLETVFAQLNEYRRKHHVDNIVEYLKSKMSIIITDALNTLPSIFSFFLILSKD